MTFDAAWSLQTALYANLCASDAVKALIGDPARVHDAIPADAVFPLVQIGGARIRPYEGLRGGFEHTLRITAFSRYGGRAECKAIAAAVHGVLQDARFPLEGHRIVQARMVFEDHLRFRDPDTYQATMRYRVVTAESPLAEVA